MHSFWAFSSFETIHRYGVEFLQNREFQEILFREVFLGFSTVEQLRYYFNRFIIIIPKCQIFLYMVIYIFVAYTCIVGLSSSIFGWYSLMNICPFIRLLLTVNYMMCFTVLWTLSQLVQTGYIRVCCARISLSKNWAFDGTC